MSPGEAEADPVHVARGVGAASHALPALERPSERLLGDIFRRRPVRAAELEGADEARVVRFVDRDETDVNAVGSRCGSALDSGAFLTTEPREVVRRGSVHD